MDHVDARDAGQRGFTLVELMIVVLILGVLMAIAIPTFLSFSSSANSRAAQSNLVIVLNAESRSMLNGQGYLNTGTALQSLEPNVAMGYPTLTTKNTVYALTPPFGGFDANSLALAASDGTKCWYIYLGTAAENNNTVPAGTFYTTGPADSGGYCSTATAPTGAPSTGSAAGGTPLTWYGRF